MFSTACLSISINGHTRGYFGFSIGVRQGDLISPLQFYLAEDFLSGYITNLVESGKVHPMAYSKGTAFVSHLIYVDGVIIFATHLY